MTIGVPQVAAGVNRGKVRLAVVHRHTEPVLQDLKTMRTNLYAHYCSEQAILCCVISDVLLSNVRQCNSLKCTVLQPCNEQTAHFTCQALRRNAIQEEYEMW